MLRNSYAGLPATLFTRIDPTAVKAPQLIQFNASLATDLQLELDPTDAAHLARIFSGNERLPGSEPIALAYAGHQFGNFVPRLGDGRAVLLGEATDRRGDLKDIQLKGAGRTVYSRGGDGRAALGPVLREYIVSEAMTALGVPSTRSLAAVLTGEPVYRQGPLPGAVVTRVASSHVRVGTFQYLAARGDTSTLKQLADYVIERHYPNARDAEAPYLELLNRVLARQASLIARWMHVGFIHGVMNTDNTSIAGETIDFGPCAFLDAYDPQTVFSSIDQHGRYAFANQPAIAQWNLARLAETLLPLIDPDQERAVFLATASVNGFVEQFQSEWLTGMRAKLGLSTAHPDDAALVGRLLSAMHESHADYTRTFRALCAAAESEQASSSAEGLPGPAFHAWLAEWRPRCASEALQPAERARGMRAVNPKYIPRNHRIEEVIVAATRGDFTQFRTLLQVVTQPFDEQADHVAYASAPLPEERVLATFCGT